MIVLLGGQEQGAKTQGMGACSTGEYRNLTSFNLTAFKIATYFHILMNIYHELLLSVDGHSSLDW